MDKSIHKAIRAIRPRRDRWVQYGEMVQLLFPLVPTKDMDEVCRTLARRLGL